MDDRHLSLDLLRAVHRGDRSPGDLATVAMAHLFEKCPRCRQTFERWRQESGEGGNAEALLHTRYDEAFDRVRARLRGDEGESGDRSTHLQAQVKAEEITAEKLAEELLNTRASLRLDLIRKDPRRFTSPALAERLLDSAKNSLPGNTREAYNLARLARAVLQHGDPTPYTTELYARALAHQANAHRADGELRSASELVEVSRFLLKPQGGGDRLTQAEVDSFEGAIRRAQRRLDEAQALFQRAAMAYAMEGRRLDAARVLLSLGLLFREMGDLARSIEVTMQAIEIVEEEGTPVLQLYALHNLTWFLNELGEHAEATRVFQEALPLYESQADPKMILRRSWLEGHLARSAGALETAESCYEAARDGFLSMGIGYDAALAALDLALLYAEQGRTAELKQVAEEIVPIFEAQDVHREAAAALMLFQDAVRAEQVTLRYLVELSRYLERARLDPSLEFQQPA